MFPSLSLFGALLVSVAVPPQQNTLSRAAIIARVDAWAAAQNAGDFTGYQALYAPSFVGIKRVGKRTTRFDRAGWMADRAKMFKNPFKVTIAGVHVSVHGPQVTVTFTQSWTSAGFHDEGPKRISFQNVGGHLLIAHEEMLLSLVRSKAQTNKLLIRWLIDKDDANDMMSATLVLEGAASRQYDIGPEEACVVPGSEGPLADGKFSSFSCQRGDCDSAVIVERRGQRILVKQVRGCEVGDASESSDTMDDFTLPPGASVGVKVEQDHAPDPS